MAKVFIGVGHGGRDAGACANGLVEAQVNLVQAQAMRDVLVRHGIQVRLSREQDEDDRLAQEIQACNAYAPDLAVECHNNAGGGDGFEVYYWPGAERSRSLAQCVEREVLKLGQNSRGIKSSTTLGWVRQVKAPCILCEGFFLDSGDRLIGDTIEKQQAFGTAYAKGVLAYLGIQYREDDDMTMTYEQFKAFMQRYEQEINEKQPSVWAKDAWDALRQAGITDGTAPQAPMTREQYAVMVHRSQGLRP